MQRSQVEEVVVKMGHEPASGTTNGIACDTLFYQDIGSSQTQALKYIGTQTVVATTGETMWCTGVKDLMPLNVIYRLHIGTEIADVNLRPFESYFSYLNPIKLGGAAITWASNWRYGFHFLPPTYGAYIESVKFHTPNITEISIGQETDIQSYKQKYQSWLKKPDKTAGLILYGVSRGTAATFCAFAKEKFPEVRLVILEAAIDTFEEVLPKRVYYALEKEYLSAAVTSVIKGGLSLFSKYRADGPSPISSVNEFPENIPVVFITSRVDTLVPAENTTRLAKALADRQKNDVYLLMLNRSSHPHYMFDDKADRDTYEAFIHAIYKRYSLQHDVQLAAKGQELLEGATLFMASTISVETPRI